MEHSFDGAREPAMGLDGTADGPRRPGDVSRGRPRRNIFPGPAPLMRTRDGAIVPDGRGDFELRDVVDVRRVGNVSGDEPSTASTTGHRVDLEGQRQRRWTSESGQEMG